jgi:DnaK suppressor protein
VACKADTPEGFGALLVKITTRLSREAVMAFGLLSVIAKRGGDATKAGREIVIMTARVKPTGSKRSGVEQEPARDRYAELKRILEERRREILSQVQEKMRDVRAEGASGETQGVLDAAESSEADIQDDIEFALIQMKSETLHKIEEALARLEEGTYGNCFECGDEISERRLRALPFAVRCKDCEEAHETAERRQRQMSQRRSAGFLLDLN